MDDQNKGVTRQRERDEPQTSAARRDVRHVPEGGDTRTEQIRSNIEQTRDDIGETIEAIQERLRPGAVVSRAAESVKNATVDRVRRMAGMEDSDDTPRRAADWYYGDGFMARVKEHPVPAAIAAASIAWIAFSKRASRDYDGPQHSGTTAHSPEASNPGSHMADRVKTGVRDGQTRARRFTSENSLAAGLFALAAGVAIGLVVPVTQRENELLGDARDALIDRAKDAAEGAVEHVREKVGEVQRVVGLGTEPITPAADSP